MASLIERIEVVALQIPLERVFSGSSYRIEKKMAIVTRVFCADGVVGEAVNGEGEIPLQLPIVGIIEKELALRLAGMDVRVDSLDVRTLGAVAKAADAMRGRLEGRLTLDGLTKDLAFHDVVLAHVDGQRPRSVVSGSGRIASDIRTRWLDATLALDTIALATLAADRVSLPLRGTLAGTLRLAATADTLALDLAVRGGGGEALVAGADTLITTGAIQSNSARAGAAAMTLHVQD